MILQLAQKFYTHTEDNATRKILLTKYEVSSFVYLSKKVYACSLYFDTLVKFDERLWAMKIF